MRLIQIFKTPSAHQIAIRELENAQRELLTAHATAEHAAKMVEYYHGVVNRLTQYVNAQGVQHDAN